MEVPSIPVTPPPDLDLTPDERKALLAVLAAAQITGAHARLIARIQDKLEASLLP